jgi:cobalt-zinc-cadmium efflux system protein
MEQDHSREHDHNRSHNHNHEPPASLKNLLLAIVINGGIVAVELVFGLMIQSMALISDAVHNPKGMRTAKRSSVQRRRSSCTGTGSITRRSRSCLLPPARWSTATTAIKGAKR